MKSSCKVCLSPRLTPDPRMNRFFQIQAGSPGAFFKCEQCSLIQRTSLPTQENEPLNLRYTEWIGGTQQAPPYMIKRLKTLERATKGRRLLDVGAGTGSFVKAATNRGWTAVGIDQTPWQPTRVDEQSANQPSPISKNIFYFDFLKETLPDENKESFDVVHSNHVLEHIENPNQFVLRCLEYLKPGGILILVVPSEIEALTSLLRRKVRFNNSKVSYYEHRFFFTRETLMSLLRMNGTTELSIQTPIILGDASLIHKVVHVFQCLIGRGWHIVATCRKPTSPFQ